MMTGEQFKTLLDAAGLSQMEASRVLGVADRTVRRWAEGKPVPPMAVRFLKVMIKLKISGDDVKRAMGEK